MLGHVEMERLVLPPNGVEPNAPRHVFHTQIYYDERQPGSQLAAAKLAEWSYGFKHPELEPALHDVLD